MKEEVKIAVKEKEERRRRRRENSKSRAVRYILDLLEEIDCSVLWGISVSM